MSPRSMATGSLLCLLLSIALGCAPEAPDRDIPPGTWLAATGGQGDHLLAMLGTIERTPVAERALEARRRLGGCQTVLAHLPELAAEPREEPAAGEALAGQDLFGALRCAEAGEIPPALTALMPPEVGSQGITFAFPIAASAPEVRVVGFARLEADGHLRLEARTAAPPAAHPLSLLLPGKEGAGTMLFHDQEALLHGRVRPDQGIDFARFVPEGSGADRMFRLKSKLFSSLVLEGSWEMAIYLPLPGRAMPDVAIALGVKDQQRAEEAMDAFLESLGENWPLRRTPLIGDADIRGECLNNVQILPDLAPCWLSLPQALVLGWNEGSIRRALAPMAPVPTGGPVPAPVTLQQGAAMAVFLDRFPVADAALGELLAWQIEPEPPIRFPWQRLLIAGDKAEGLYRFRLRLMPSPPAPEAP